MCAPGWQPLVGDVPPEPEAAAEAPDNPFAALAADDSGSDDESSDSSSDSDWEDTSLLTEAEKKKRDKRRALAGVQKALQGAISHSFPECRPESLLEAAETCARSPSAVAGACGKKV